MADVNRDNNYLNLWLSLFPLNKSRRKNSSEIGLFLGGNKISS